MTLHQNLSAGLKDAPFAILAGGASHIVCLPVQRFDYRSEHEPGGQLLRCLSGEMELSGASGRWSIPADHMVYVPPERPFRIRSLMPSSAMIVKFCDAEVPWRRNGCWVGPVSGFAAGMLDYGRCFGQETAMDDSAASAYFHTLGRMLLDWFNHERIMWTPYAKSAPVQKIVDLVLSRGPNLSAAEAADYVGMSERTLRRHMQAEIGQNWREFIRELKMNRAMELLRKARMSVTETAFELGFASSSAFSHAFAEYVGKTPSAYAKSFNHGAFVGRGATAPGNSPLQQ